MPEREPHELEAKLHYRAEMKRRLDDLAATLSEAVGKILEVRPDLLCDSE